VVEGRDGTVAENEQNNLPIPKTQSTINSSTFGIMLARTTLRQRRAIAAEKREVNARLPRAASADSRGEGKTRAEPAIEIGRGCVHALQDPIVRKF